MFSAIVGILCTVWILKHASSNFGDLMRICGPFFLATFWRVVHTSDVRLSRQLSGIFGCDLGHCICTLDHHKALSAMYLCSLWVLCAPFTQCSDFLSKFKDLAGKLCNGQIIDIWPVGEIFRRSLCLIDVNHQEFF